MRTAVAPILLVAALAACNGEVVPDPGPGDVAAPEPCSLVTQEEAAQALGAPVAEGAPSTVEGTGELCAFESDAGRVTVMVYDDPMTADELRAEDAPGEVVVGTGDAAYYYQLTGDLRVVEGDVMFHVGVFPNLQPSREGAEGLAAIAVARA